MQIRHTGRGYVNSLFYKPRNTKRCLRSSKERFENNPDIQWFDALIQLLRASWLFSDSSLSGEGAPHPCSRWYQRRCHHGRLPSRRPLFLADPTKALEEFKNDLRNDIQTASYTRDTEVGILQFVDDVVSKKICLKAHPTQRLHAKLYIFRPKGFNEHKPGAVITGSSNLTAAGLESTGEEVSNYEFKLMCCSTTTRTCALPPKNLSG